MATLDDIREIVAELPGSELNPKSDGAVWQVRRKPFVWECMPWPSVPEAAREIIARELVVGVSIADPLDGLALAQMHPDVFLDESSKWGGPKVTFRMAGIELDHLRELVIESWRIHAPNYLVREYEER